MSIAISSHLPIPPLAPSLGAGAAPAAGGGADFGSIINSAIQGVEQPGREADQAIQNLLNGDGELHTVALATQRADLAFDLGLQIRNKVVSAYQEVMKLAL